MSKVQEKPYRIEERGWPTIAIPALEFDDRTEALQVFDAILHVGAEMFERNPSVCLVLLGPDRTARQLTTEPGGDVNTVTSADGTEWHRMSGGWSPGPLDAPIDFAVLAEFHGPIFAGGVR